MAVTTINWHGDLVLVPFVHHAWSACSSSCVFFHQEDADRTDDRPSRPSRSQLPEAELAGLELTLTGRAGPSRGEELARDLLGPLVLRRRPRD